MLDDVREVTHNFVQAVPLATNGSQPVVPMDVIATTVTLVSRTPSDALEIISKFALRLR